MTSDQVRATGTATVRTATPSDGPACAAIYRDYTRTAVVNLEVDPPSAHEMSERIEEALATHAWVVVEHDGLVVGYACAGPFLARAAFRQAAVVGIYLAPEHRGRRLGRLLYRRLFAELLARDFRVALALVVPSNSRSTAFHAELGFVHVGTWPQVAWKHGAWRDLACLQRMLADDDADLPAWQ